MQGRKIFQDRRHLRFSLKEAVPKHNLYYRLKEVLRLDFLSEHTRSYYGSCGQKSIDPEVFFKLCLIKHLENIDSDRKLMEVCSLRLDLRYFLGYNLDEALPWHSTVSRTRQRLSKDLFDSLFTHILSLCVDAGMVAGNVQAIDSAYIKANASMDSLELKVSKEKLQEERQLSSARRPAKENKASQEERTVSARKDELQEIARRQNKWSQDKRPGAGIKESKFTSNKTHYSPVDPDARIAVKPGKPRQLCYFNQLSVDTAHHVITHTQADFSDKKDSQCLPSIVEKVEERLKSFDLPCTSIAADAGYCSGENLHLLEAKRIEAFIPIHGTYKGGPEGFIYHREEDYWECPNGKKVTFRRIVLTASLIKQRQYFTRRSDCKDCPFRESCIGKRKEKRIDITYFMDEYTRALELVNSKRGRQMKLLRHSTVEPVFGTLINFMALKRINTRGIVQAEKVMLAAACAYNLKKWLNFSQNRRKTAAMAMVKPLNGCFFTLLFLIRPRGIIKGNTRLK